MLKMKIIGLKLDKNVQQRKGQWEYNN